jgi:agmatinase
MYLGLRTLAVAAVSLGSWAHQQHALDDHDQTFFQESQEGSKTWLEKYGPQFDQPFSGPLSFSHLPYFRCLENVEASFDIAILGMPFDTAVSYRPGARFGPFAIRSGSRRQRDIRGYTLSWGNNPYTLGQKIIDCGDVPVSPFDNAQAVDQMEVAYSTLLARTPARDPEVEPATSLIARDGIEHPRIVTLGGDHTIVLPILRSLNKVYGPISVIHFDAHLDTWAAYPGQTTEQSRITHGTFFYIAREEGLLANNSVHAGIRCKLGGIEDLENDDAVGFQLISTDDIDDLGIPTIISKIRQRIGDSPVYLSLDIDVIDPGLAPATGTPEPGGWTPRELKRILRGLAGLNFVGADIVEVAPAYDNAEITGIAAADFVHDFLSMLLTKEPPKHQAHHKHSNAAH